MFLRTPGQAPAHILNAIYQDHALKYFDFDLQRQDANMAHFQDKLNLNVKEGMPYEERRGREVDVELEIGLVKSEVAKVMRCSDFWQEFNGFFVKRQQLGVAISSLLDLDGRERWPQPATWPRNGSEPRQALPSKAVDLERAGELREMAYLACFHVKMKASSLPQAEWRRAFA